MQKMLALVGDKTTTGGVVLDGTTNILCNGKGVAVLGSKVTCPTCLQGVGEVIEGANHCLFGNGRPVAYDGCIVACGCSIGANRVISSASNVFVGVHSDNNSFSNNDLTQSNAATLNNYTDGEFVHTASYSNSSFSNLFDKSKLKKDKEYSLWEIYKKVVDDIPRQNLPSEKMASEDDPAMSELTSELKESYLNLLCKLYPSNFSHTDDANLITLELANYLNQMALSIDKCISDIDHIFIASHLVVRLTPASVVKIFIDLIAETAKENSLKHQACINTRKSQFKTKIFEIVNGVNDEDEI